MLQINLYFQNVTDQNVTNMTIAKLGKLGRNHR